jgi:hypothetical protein
MATTKRVIFAKIVDNRVIILQEANEIVIRACFDSCTPCVQRKVGNFLSGRRQRQKTLYFNGFKVVLKKIRG